VIGACDGVRSALEFLLDLSCSVFGREFVGLALGLVERSPWGSRRSSPRQTSAKINCRLSRLLRASPQSPPPPLEWKTDCRHSWLCLCVSLRLPSALSLKLFSSSLWSCFTTLRLGRVCVPCAARFPLVDEPRGPGFGPGILGLVLVWAIPWRMAQRVQTKGQGLHISPSTRPRHGLALLLRWRHSTIPRRGLPLVPRSRRLRRFAQNETFSTSRTQKSKPKPTNLYIPTCPSQAFLWQSFLSRWRLFSLVSV